MTKGVEGMRENPLWLVFFDKTQLFPHIYRMGISADHEKNKISPQKSPMFFHWLYL